MKKLLAYICFSLLCFAQTKTSEHSDIHIKALNGVTVTLKGINITTCTWQNLFTAIQNETGLNTEKIQIHHGSKLINHETANDDIIINFQQQNNPYLSFFTDYKNEGNQILQQYYERTHPKQNRITNTPQATPEHYFAMGMLFTRCASIYRINKLLHPDYEELD